MLPENLLPQWAKVDAFIAGGFAACPPLASDIDVWVPVDINTTYNPWDAVLAARDTLAAHLREIFGTAFTPQDDENTLRGQAHDRNRLISTHENYPMPIPIYRVGTVIVPGSSLPYHVIAVGGSVDDVLSSFDISTHQVALHPSKGVITGECWTPIMVEPVVIQQKYSTESRVHKIRARYGFPPLENR